jgi:hypothetical protein
MKKKVLVVLIALCLGGGASLYALPSIGIYGTYMGDTTGGYTSGIGLTAKFGEFPVIGLKYNLNSNYTSLGLSCDYMIIDKMALLSPLDFDLGIGAFIGLGIGGNNLDFNIGARIPFGLQLFVASKIEIYLNLVPLVYFYPNPNLAFGGELGIRFQL